jgi:UDP-2,3-diacylglucosamine hydrolase
MSSSRFLFISDLHLDASAPAAIVQFKTFLTGMATQCDALYILGDLFESWVGDDDDEPARNEICKSLNHYTTAGHRCFVMRGNRDFLLGAGFEQRTGCTLLSDPMLLEFGDIRAFVSHGDPLCTSDFSYQELRSIVRSPEWRRRFLKLPLALRRSLADVARSGSKAHTKRMQTQILDVTDTAVLEAFRVANCSLMIHGHTHRPAVHTHWVDERKATRIVLGDWYEQGSCLALYGDGRHELQSLARA